MVLRKVILNAITDPYKYLHTDAFAILLGLGYDRYGVVKNSIIHVSGDNIIQLVRRRAAYKKWHYDKNRNKRFYMVYNPAVLRDTLNLIRFAISSLLIFPTCIESMWWFLHKRDLAWFLHPIVCYLITIGYGVSEMKYYLDYLLTDNSQRIESGRR
jgi:hypothetical protein